MNKCSNCRFWSEMCAQVMGGGQLEALCLSRAGPFAGKYTTEGTSCESWKSGHYGAVDSPPDYGETAVAAYEAEEGAAP